jgi:ankyrin repeat protein
MIICSHHFTGLHNQGISILLNCFWKDMPIQMLLPNGRTHHLILLLETASGIKCGHAEVARLLLDSGADATLANDNMFTPLHCAAQSGHLDLVKLLLERRADPNAVTNGRAHHFILLLIKDMLR